MWGMEYNPNIFSLYEEPDSEQGNSSQVNGKQLKQYGKFVRKNVQSGQQADTQSALAVFLVASVLETKNKKLLKEAKGLDDVVKVLFTLPYPFLSSLNCYSVHVLKPSTYI